MSKKKKYWVVYFNDSQGFCGTISLKEWKKGLGKQYVEYKRYVRWERAIEVVEKHQQKRYNIT